MSARPPLSLADFHTLLHSIHTTIRDPPSWITLKLSLLSLSQPEHLELEKEINSIDLQVESFGKLVKAFEDGVGDGKHLKIVIIWKANFSAILESRKPPSPFDAIDRSEMPPLEPVLTPVPQQQTTDEISSMKKKRFELRGNQVLEKAAKLA
ncbi:hypothetical protein JCM5350_001370 [Sporobolomyces pararoseus]